MLKSNIMKLYHKYREFILYVIIGSFSAFMDFICYVGLMRLGLPYYIANTFSVILGMTISFILNRNYNFQVSDNVVYRFIMFFGVGFAGLLLSNLLIFLMVNVIAINPMLSKLLSIGIVALFQFLLNKFITFKARASE